MYRTIPVTIIEAHAVDPDFLRDLMPYVAKAATGRALGKSWEEIAAVLGVPAGQAEGLPVLAPKEWERCTRLAREFVTEQGVAVETPTSDTSPQREQGSTAAPLLARRACKETSALMSSDT